MHPCNISTVVANPVIFDMDKGSPPTKSMKYGCKALLKRNPLSGLFNTSEAEGEVDGLLRLR